MGESWRAPVAGLATMLMLAWFGLWWLQPSPPTSRSQASQESIWPFIEIVSAMIFPNVDIAPVTIPDPLSDLDDLQAAITGEWPCEESEMLSTVACDHNTLALLLGEP
jgi:hypothetical protein